MSDLGEPESPAAGPSLLQRLPKGLILVLAALAVMWLLEIIDTVGAGLNLDQHGVRLEASTVSTESCGHHFCMAVLVT